jgi:hypothetical protein
LVFSGIEIRSRQDLAIPQFSLNVCESDKETRQAGKGKNKSLLKLKETQNNRKQNFLEMIFFVSLI